MHLHKCWGPGLIQTETQFQLTTKDFEVLDRVSATGKVVLWFGAVMTGGKGYQALLEKAQEMGGDEVMNYSFDYKQKSVLLFIYSEIQWKATGLAVKLKPEVKSWLAFLSGILVWKPLKKLWKIMGRPYF